MSHYFDEKPESASLPQEIQTRIQGIDFQFTTDSGVFSRHRMDYGSELLLETFIAECPARTGRLLDLGCGYGPVGIVLKRVFPALDVTLSDINTRALELARQNARANQTAGVQIVKSDGLGALSGPYDFILTNPPIRAGKATVHRFFAEAREKLGSGGLLYVVIQKKQGAPSALKRLRELFADVEVIEHSAGYWVIRARA